MHKILHLVPPDAKFAPHITSQFTDGEFRHCFRIIGTSESDKFSHDKRLTCVPASSNELETQAIVVEYDGIVAHSMIVPHAKIVSRIPAEFPIAWMLFGHEYYNTIGAFASHTLSPRSLQFLKGFPLTNRLLHFKRTALAGRLNNWLDLVRGRRPLDPMIRNSLQRVHLAGFPVREEFEMVRDTLNLSADYQWFCTVSIAESELCDPSVEKPPCIVLGNSSTLENNHLDIIEFLKTRRRQFESCFVPLSYGNVYYRKALCEFGDQTLGDQFVPWVDFQEPSEYRKQIKSCQIGIMNHYRQQGVGTSLMLLAQGTRLFLNERSSVYHCFKRMGFHVFGIEKDLIGSASPLLAPLSVNEQQANQDLVLKHFGKEIVNQRSVEFIRTLVS